jgi:hypothetical protein
LTILGTIQLIRHKKPDTSVPEPSYPTADSVVCVADPVPPPGASTATTSVAAAQSSSSFSFGQQTAAASDPERVRGQRLAQRITLDFLNALKSVTSKH